MVTMACIAGEEVYRQWESGRIRGAKLGPRQTPFGKSNEIFLVKTSALAPDDAGAYVSQPVAKHAQTAGVVAKTSASVATAPVLDSQADGPDGCFCQGSGENAQTEFYLMPRYGAGIRKSAPHKVNARANMYALKDLGVQAVLAWGPAGAITHNIAVGDLVIVSDLIDKTYLRDKTFFEDCPLGFLRQFPVFCPSLRKLLAGVLGSMKLVYHSSATEVRMLAAMGAELVTHTFVPEVFLAKELQMCYASLCYVVNYAETGSSHRTFAAGELFGGLTQKSDTDRLAGALAAMSNVAANILSAAARSTAQTKHLCDCHQTMLANQRHYNLPDDWRQWFATPG
jgi:5'-methylthioadenosine phosphorylase